MALKDSLKVTRKTFFNPRAWVGYDNLKSQTLTVWAFVKDITTQQPQRPEREETFEQAMARQGVGETELKSIQQTYFFYALLFVGLAILDLIYAIYLLFHHHAFLGLVLGLAVCAMLLGQAFKYHFWYFEIKHRKLGCTFEEWKSGKINDSNTRSGGPSA